MDKTDLAYAAGIIDGEGCITIAKNKQRAMRRGICYSVIVLVVNTNLDLLSWLEVKFGGKATHWHPRNPAYKDTFTWRLHGENATLFLKAILPYLKLKRLQVEVAIDFQRSIHQGQIVSDEQFVVREAHKILMASLNRKGPIPKES